MGSVRHALPAGARMVSVALAALVPGPAAARAYDCDQACRIEWAWAAPRRNALPRTAFYDAPGPLRWAPTGTLIHGETTSDYVVEGRPVKATCVLYHGDQMMRFLEQGYAVVAPDYAGLGTTGRPELLDKTAEAEDLVGAVRSARQAVPGLSRDWVLWGHSQGGSAALGFAERQAHRPEPGYLGAVVTSPAADLATLADHVAGTPPYGGFIPLPARGAAFSDPRIAPARLPAPAALQRLDVTRDGCLNVAIAVYADLSGSLLAGPGYFGDPDFRRYLRDNSLGSGRVAGPVLFLQGGADTVTPPRSTRRSPPRSAVWAPRSTTASTTAWSTTPTMA